MEKVTKNISYIKPFYKTANTLLKMKVDTVEDIRNFYIGINNLASEVSLNTLFINELGSVEYSDNIKLHEAINYILGYGKVIEKSNLFTKTSIKKVNLNTFLEKNPRAENQIKTIQTEAQVYFSKTKKAIDSYSKVEVDELLKGLDKKFNSRIEELKKVAVLSLWVTKDSNGDYCFDGKRIYIKSKDADYAIIFDIIYFLTPLGGKMEYKKILEECKKRKLQNVNRKSILRALTGKKANLFRYVKDLKQELPFGTNLFVAMQNGKEIEFCNQK